MSFTPPNQKKQKGPITEDLDIALENWQYWIYSEWLGDTPEEQDQRANLIYEIIKKHDNNATVQRRPGRDNKGVVYTFTVSLYGNPDDVLNEINEIQSILLKFTDNYKVRAGEAYAWVQGMESNKMVPASLGNSTDMADAVSSLLDSVYGVKQTSQPSPNQSTPPSDLSTENNLEKKDADENPEKYVENAKKHIQQGIDFLNQVDALINRYGKLDVEFLQIIEALSQAAKKALERYYENNWDRFDTQGEIPVMYEDFVQRVNKILSSMGYRKQEEINEENLSPYPRYYSPYDPNVRGDNQSWLPEHISINSVPATHNPPLPPRQASPWDTGITNENVNTSGNDFTDNKRRVDSNYGY